MSRKNKIIVSVVGIVIVTLALLGITYAYYLTRIQGNTNTNSISITTANLLLKYDDGSGAIVEEDIMPGVTFTKTFSVTNEGNAKIDNYVVYLEEVINDLTRTEDLTYTLTCTSTAGDCAGGSGEYPKFAGIIATNSIEEGETHNYTLTVTYENLPNTDQSIDMGSRINGYIQIYNLTDIVDLTGSVTNAVDGDYVQINSVQKISQIVDGKYTLGAIEPGNHTITVRYKDSNGEEQIRSTKTITIQKGETAGVSGNVITVTNDSQTVNINIDATNADNTTINNTIKEYNPFNEGTLAYNIFKNAKENKNGTEFLSVPKTEVAKTTSMIISGFEKSEESLQISGEELIALKDYFKVSNNALLACEGEKNTENLELVDKYFCLTTENMVFYVDAYDLNSDIYTVYPISLISTNSEKTLSKTSDDYGVSYYFRGGVVDNYVTFSNKCWRIVRILGDGSIKLVLEDQDQPCSTSINGNWALYPENGSPNYGYDFYRNPDGYDADNGFLLNYLDGNYEKSNSMASTFKKFEQLFTENELQKLKSGGWCLGDLAYTRSESTYKYTKLESHNHWSNMYYDSYMRLSGENENGYQPTLKCNGTKMNVWSDNTKMFVGALTTDEIVYAGSKFEVENRDIYLINEEFSKGTEGSNNTLAFWTLSPSYYSADGPHTDNVYCFGYRGSITSQSVFNSTISFRPSVTLKSGLECLSGGEGTIDNPYVVN